MLVNSLHNVLENLLDYPKNENFGFGEVIMRHLARFSALRFDVCLMPQIACVDIAGLLAR